MNNSTKNQQKLVTINEETGYPTYQNKPLGCLKWGHLALIEYYGDHFSSLAAYEEHQVIEKHKLKALVANTYKSQKRQ